MSLSPDPFVHLSDRCTLLLNKYIEPIIKAEEEAVKNSLPLPIADFDSFAAFRLLTHAELEGYFETKARLALKSLDDEIKNGTEINSKTAALIFLYLLKRQKPVTWTATGLGDDAAIRGAETADFRRLALEAFGFGNKFIDSNNGIKENSIYVLSALMGFFDNELDSILVAELNQYGKKRGDVAHDSWERNTRTFDSADIEKNRLLKILKLINNFYEQKLPSHKVAARTNFLRKVAISFKLVVAHLYAPFSLKN